MEQAKNAAQDAKTTKDLEGRPWYASVSVKDGGPEAGRLRYGLYYREVYYDNPPSQKERRMSRSSDVESPTKQVWERYKHLDELLSDSGWIGAAISDHILCEVWRAVKAEHGEVAEASGGEQ